MNNFLDSGGVTKLWDKTKKSVEQKQDKLVFGKGITVDNNNVSVTLPAKSLTLDEYNNLSEQEKLADVQYIIIDDSGLDNQIKYKDRTISGKDATINGENVVTIKAGENVNIVQEGGVLTISAMGGKPALQSLLITTPPEKTIYNLGEVFDPTGMVVAAVYEGNLLKTVTDYTITPNGPLSADVKKVVISYNDNGVVVTAEQAISVFSWHIYGVEWDGSSQTKWTRTDGAALFTDPVPAVSNGTGSSPFDGLMPWAGMVKETRSAGVMVKEPKYWFKWTKTGKKLKLQIADGPVDGFHVDPVNMDRGDGLGELDFSYIGRYHCGTSDWKSATGVAQKCSITRRAARTGIHGLGANFWQIDFAQFWYVNMLFIVEFADWNGERIGRGCSASGSKENNGKTDAMQYHTGTTAANRDTYGFTQYRNIEGWWDNVYDWMDGCYYTSSGLNVILNPSKFSDNANGVLVGKPTDGYPSDFAIPTQSGLEWALYPCAKAGSTTTYVPDYWNFSGGDPCLFHGGYYYQSQRYGPFCVYYYSTSGMDGDIGCRLQERPPKAA